jgi:hypothetical protein
MIVVTKPSGERVHLAARHIAAVEETGVSSKWHGISAIVRTFSGTVIEARESAGSIAAAISADAAALTEVQSS